MLCYPSGTLRCYSYRVSVQVIETNLQPKCIYNSVIILIHASLFYNIGNSWGQRLYVGNYIGVLLCVRVHAILDEWLIRQRNAQCFGWMSSSGPSMQITMQITTSRGLTSGNLKSSWYTETSTRQITKELNHRCENNRMGVLWNSCVVKHVMQTLNVKFHQREMSSWGEIEIWIWVCPSSGVYAKGFIISETMLW